MWATNGTMFMGSLGSKKWRRQGGHGPDAGAERWRQNLTNEQMTLRAQGSLAPAGSRSLEVTPPCEGCEGTTGCGEKHPALFYVKPQRALVSNCQWKELQMMVPIPAHRWQRLGHEAGFFGK
ncbi:hypothetical protein V494_01476 [Pseudogymnoascus sp. VKM F-4513 (FW-928)]|nr:hypothetical protein V494_01476 [Pseudogymnoascus sp. VKM F-4513 (FW-928)]